MCSSERLEIGTKNVCILLSIAMLGLGVYMVYSGTNADNALFRYKAFVFPSEFATSSRVVILIGAFVFAVIWIQLSAAIKESVDIMFMSTCLLAYLVICGAVSIYCGLNDQPKLITKLYFGMLSSLQRFNEDSDDGYYFKKEWELLQLSKNCCGTDSYVDWQRVRMMPDEPPVPPSCCCIRKVAWCSRHITFNATIDSQWIHTQGCYSEVLDEVSIRKQWNAVIPFEVVGSLSVVLSTLLVWAWHRRSRERHIGRAPPLARPFRDLNDDNQVLVIDSNSESNSESATDSD